jgi:hypothetical protein
MRLNFGSNSLLYLLLLQDSFIDLFKMGNTGSGSTGVDNYWVVQADCHHSDLEWEGTNSNIKVTWFTEDNDGREVFLGSKIRKARIVCEYDDGDAYWGWHTADGVKVTHFLLETDGNDAYFIDELYIYTNDGVQRQFGVDDHNGWCLSTDKQDTFRLYDQTIPSSTLRNTKCVDALRFQMSTGLTFFYQNGKPYYYPRGDRAYSVNDLN